MTPTGAAGRVELESYEVPEERWTAHARELFQEGWWFEALWGEAAPAKVVYALWGRRGSLRLLRLACPHESFPSLTALMPASDWFERALRDRTGLVPRGHVDPRPFLFHEAYPAGHVEGRPLPDSPDTPSPEYPFLRHEGSGVFEIPVGPIHAGIIEPGHFRFTTAGELILDLELRLNYTHKGTLDLARGKTIEHAVRLLERLSGDNAAAHASAFASACEAAFGQRVSPGVQETRSLLVELERVYNHVGDLGGIATDVALPAAASHFQALKEEFMRWNQRLFGHRLLMNVVAYGGLHHAPTAATWMDFLADLAKFRTRFERAVEMTANHSGLKERVEGTGQLKKSTAELLGCVGPAARASGIARDARIDAPCLAYPERPVEIVTRDRGSVSSRMWVRIDETRRSLEWIREAAAPSAASAVPPPGGPVEGLALVEASRGAVLSWVRVRDGRVEIVYQRDPSFLNWRGLDESVWRNIVPDFPVINKSFGLSYSGSDA